MIVKLLTTAVVLTVIYLHWSEPSCLQHKHRHTGWNLAKWILTWSGKYKNCSKYKDSGQWFLHLNLAFWTVFFFFFFFFSFIFQMWPSSYSSRVNSERFTRKFYSHTSQSHPHIQLWWSWEVSEWHFCADMWTRRTME